MNEESIFAHAMGIQDANERQIYLDQACQGNAALRSRLEVLISAAENEKGILDIDATATQVTVLGEQIRPFPTIAPNSVIDGRFRIIELIGEGGMGEVYVAEQIAPVRRKVALKLVKPGLDSKAVLARFIRERQTLALMDHPNIAKVFDGGLTESGRPYFVMEYLKGWPITEYCDRVCMPIRKRLELFMTVCQAVQHAHQKGIIHRDIKPSNILVALFDDQPVIKVIDFGLAKILEHSNWEASQISGHAVIVGTPLYMSPEQAQLNNLDIDTRSDLYALGVILYELLTGSTPIEREQFRQAAWNEAMRMVRDFTPPPPSNRISSSESIAQLAEKRQVEPSRLHRFVRGELDWIVMKAIEKDRSRRYPTATSLSEDIAHFLNGDPVNARPPSTIYYLTKFASRYRVLIASLAAILFVLLLGVAGTSYGLVLARIRMGELVTARANERAERISATEARRRAELGEERAKEAFDKLEVSAARSNYLLAISSWKTNRLRVAREILSGIPQSHRGLEWDIANHHFQGGYATFYLRGLTCCRLSPNATKLAAGNSNGQVVIWDVLTQSQLNSFACDSDIAQLEWIGDDELVLATGGHLRFYQLSTGVSRSVATQHRVIRSFLFSRDRTRYLTCDYGGNIKVWDSTTDAILRSFEVGDGQLLFMAVNPREDQLATSNRDHTLCLWDIKTGERLASADSGSEVCYGLAFTADGKEIVTGGSQGIVKFWNSDSLALLRAWDSQCSFINSLAISPDNSHVVVGGKDHSVRLMEYRGDSSTVLRGHVDAVSSVCFTADSMKIVSCGSDNTIKLRKLDCLENTCTTYAHAEEILVVEYSPKEDVLVTCSSDGTCKLWNSNTHELVWGAEVNSPVESVAFSPDGKRIAAGKQDASIDLLDAETGMILGTLRGNEYRIDKVKYSHDGELLASASAGATLIWDTTNLTLLKKLEQPYAAIAIDFSPDDQTLLSCHRDFNVRLWNLKDNIECGVVGGFARPSTVGEFSPDGRQFLVASENLLKIYDSKTLKEVLVLAGHTAAVNHAAYTSDGKRIYSCGNDHSIRLWDATNGDELFHFEGHTAAVKWVALSREGHRLASVSRDKTLRTWNLTSEPSTQHLRSHKERITDVALSPDKRLIASAGVDNTIKLWDARSGDLLRTLLGHSDWVMSVAFSPDGRHLVSGSRNHMLGLWDLDTFEVKWSGDVKLYPIERISFSRDGRQILTGGFSKEVWDAETGELLKDQPLFEFPPDEAPQLDADKSVVPVGTDVVIIDRQVQASRAAELNRFLQGRSDVTWHRVHGTKCLEQNDFYAAVVHLSSALLADPDHVLTFDNLQQAREKWLTKEGDVNIDQYPSVIAKAQQIKPGTKLSEGELARVNNLLWGIVQRRTTQKDHGRILYLAKALTLAVQERPKEYYANTLGVAAYRLERWEDAMDWCQKSMAMRRNEGNGKPDNPIDLAVITISLSKMGRAHDAKKKAASLEVAPADSESGRLVDVEGLKEDLDAALAQ